MWIGVDRGFAGIKFSVSPKAQGAKVLSLTARIIKTTNPIKSFQEK